MTVPGILRDDEFKGRMKALIDSAGWIGQRGRRLRCGFTNRPERRLTGYTATAAMRNHGGSQQAFGSAYARAVVVKMTYRDRTKKAGGGPQGIANLVAYVEKD